MFMLFMFIVVSMAGTVAQGSVGLVRTHLTANLTSVGTTINVADTTGFPSTGMIDIEGEHIGYSSKTATTFVGSVVNPLTRGTSDTTAAAHAENVQVATIEAMMINTTMNYRLAVLADPTGALSFLQFPIQILQILGDFMFLPLNFLGTDLEILTIVWAVFGIGLLVTIILSIARRV